MQEKKLRLNAYKVKLSHYRLGQAVRAAGC